MAWWGISLSEGPNYNAPVMDEDRSASAWGALQEALARINNTNLLERALIEALSTRYENPWSENRAHLEQAFADAMAKVWAEYPNNSDVGALYAEAMMIQRPWKLYDPDRKPTGNTPEILTTLQRVMQLDPRHPGVFHLYVHAVEPSLEPGDALAAADHLRNMVPAAGHMLHMPSHIYVQVGQWDKSILQNSKAVKQDDQYRSLSPEPKIQIMYMVHNAHMLAFSAMMVGQETEAMAVARKMWTIIPEESPFGRDMAHKVLDVADLFIADEIALQKEDWYRAAEILEKAAAIEDTLSYGEPPQYLQPVRHTLGAVYMKAGNFEAAEKVYRKDLGKWENNGWSLFGLSRALMAQDKQTEAQTVKDQYLSCWSKADEQATTSCLCIQEI